MGGSTACGRDLVKDVGRLGSSENRSFGSSRQITPKVATKSVDEWMYRYGTVNLRGSGRRPVRQIICRGAVTTNRHGRAIYR